MIQKVNDETTANLCDDLLTKLIQDEREYDNTIVSNFVVKDYFKNIIKNKNNILLCYKEKENVIGYIFLKYIINDNNKKSYLIDGLYVEKEYRNRGIGKQLIKEGLNILKQKKIDFIDINVLYKNMVARKLYKSFGFDELKISMRKNIF